MTIRNTFPELIAKTFLTWEMEDKDGKPIRAIALCDDNGWYHEGLNTMMDSQMGEKDEDGIYERIWMEDEIPSSATSTVCYATHEQVEIYLKHCPHIEHDIEECDGTYHKLVGIVQRELRTDAIFKKEHRVDFEYETKC